MSTWLEPLRAALARLPGPATFFFRDDDTGWEDAALFRLLDVFAAEAAFLDLAVIPGAIGKPLAEALAVRSAETNRRLRFHQHGYAHVNHEASGRKCEFGPSRGFVAQQRDIAAGRARLADLFGAHLDPIFTPPWNRCTQATVMSLSALGFSALSRDATADALQLDGLADVSVGVDWAKREHANGAGFAAVGAQLAEAAARRRVVGIMLHHAWLVDEDMQALHELLRILSRHPNARLATMAELIPRSRSHDL